MNKTNFEKIKEMNIEDFANFIRSVGNCTSCAIFSFCNNQKYGFCNEIIQQWLESECEE